VQSGQRRVAFGFRKGGDKVTCRCDSLSRPVLPQIDTGRLHCPSHRGYFDLWTGRPLAGPPRRELPQIALEVRDGVVYATGIEEKTV
jgi:Rieske Fe-S protein